MLRRTKAVRGDFILWILSWDYSSPDFENRRRKSAWGRSWQSSELMIGDLLPWFCLLCQHIIPWKWRTNTSKGETRFQSYCSWSLLISPFHLFFAENCIYQSLIKRLFTGNSLSAREVTHRAHYFGGRGCCISKEL